MGTWPKPLVQTSCTPSHDEAILYLICYLKKTRELGIRFKPDPKMGFECYCDTDFSGSFASVDPSTSKSSSGWVIFYAGCPSHGLPNINPRLRSPLQKPSTSPCLSIYVTSFLCPPRNTTHIQSTRQSTQQVHKDIVTHAGKGPKPKMPQESNQTGSASPAITATKAKANYGPKQKMPQSYQTTSTSTVSLAITATKAKAKANKGPKQECHSQIRLKVHHQQYPQDHNTRTTQILPSADRRFCHPCKGHSLDHLQHLIQGIVLPDVQKGRGSRIMHQLQNRPFQFPRRRTLGTLLAGMLCEMMGETESK